MQRRQFLESLALSAVALPLARAYAEDKDAVASSLPQALGLPDPKPYKFKPSIAKLPAWTLGDASQHDKWTLMFRGNLSHTFYGSGTVPAEPKLLWKFEMAEYATLKHGEPTVWKGSGWTGQSLRYGDYVWIGSTGGHMHCFEAMTGKLVWVFAAQRMIKGSPCLWSNRLYFVCVDNYLRCLDAATGKLLWQWRSPNDVDSSPCVYQGRLYVGGEDGAVKCFDPLTGKLHWKKDFGVGCCEKPGSGGIESSIAIASGRAYFGHLDGHVRAIDPADGKILWATKIGGDTDASPVIVGDRLWIGTEEPNDAGESFFCLSATDGRKLWARKLGGIWSSAAVVDGKLYVGTHGGKMLCLDPATGDTIWSYEIGISTWNSPSVVDGKVLFGAYDRYYRILDAATGKLLWKFDVGDRCHSAAAIADGRIWVGSASGTYYCFG